MRLVLTQRKLPDDREYRISVSAGWHAHMAILIAKLEGVEPLPFWGTHTLLESEYDVLLA